MTELLGCADAVVSFAEAPDITVFIGSAFRKWNNVVGDGGRFNPALGLAVTAERLGTQPAQALCLAGAAA